MKQIKVFKGNVELLQSAEELSSYLKGCKDNSLLTFDWETTGLKHDAIPLGLSLHQRGRDPVFAPIDYMFTGGIPMRVVADLCNEQFPRLQLIAHNAKYDSMISVMNGIKDECCNIVADTLIMIHLYDPTLEKKLEKRVQQDFGYEKLSFDKICGKKWNKINWSLEGDALLESLAGYAGEDSYWETQVYYKYLPLLDEDAWRVMHKIELPMIKILRDAKIRGVLIDVPFLRQMGVEIDARLSEAISAIYEEAGCVFNLNSSKQKQEVFFKKLKLPIISTTKSGSASTDSNSAEQWSEMGYPIGERLMEYSELNKLNTGYIQAIPELVDSENVLRGDINSCGTETGRCSSSNPNLQNQPNNHDFPVRQAFIPREGYVFLNYDYSQLELRVMAHMSKDKHFTEVFWKGEDPHGDVAKRLGISRKGAKVVNFGVLYGMGPDKLAKTIGVSPEEAKRIITIDYMRVYYGFASWKDSTERFAKRNGFVRNLFGRMRRLPDAAKDPYHVDKKKFYSAMRQSVNTIIQGTGADIVKLATIAAVKKLAKAKLDAHFILQVHDELVFEVRRDQMMEAQHIIIDCMENTTKLDVPLLVDGKIILNWGEMKSDDILSLPLRYDHSLNLTLL